MAYDEGLAERIRAVLDDERGISEKKMFGGVAFLLDGKMFVGIVKDDLMVRLGPHTRPMDFTGKPMAGYIYVSPAGVEDNRALGKWIRLAAKFVAALPEKKKPAKKKSSKRSK